MQMHLAHIKSLTLGIGDGRHSRSTRLLVRTLRVDSIMGTKVALTDILPTDVIRCCYREVDETGPEVLLESCTYISARPGCGPHSVWRLTKTSSRSPVTDMFEGKCWKLPTLLLT